MNNFHSISPDCNNFHERRQRWEWQRHSATRTALDSQLLSSCETGARRPRDRSGSVKNAPGDFPNAARRSVTSAIGGVGCFSRRLNVSFQQLVAIGTGVASGPPPHRSEWDVLPHPALMIQATAADENGKGNNPFKRTTVHSNQNPTSALSPPRIKKLSRGDRFGMRPVRMRMGWASATP